MEHDPATYLIGIGITALATIIVAWISRSRASKTVAADRPFVPQESGEHAHTRDLIKIEFEAVHRRFDTIEATRAAERKSNQLGESQRRLDERGRE